MDLSKLNENIQEEAAGSVLDDCVKSAVKKGMKESEAKSKCQKAIKDFKEKEGREPKAMYLGSTPGESKEFSDLLETKGAKPDFLELDRDGDKEITHMCALHVIHESSGRGGHPIKHTLDESGNVTHYSVEFTDVIVENIPVGNLKILQQEEHTHKRDDEKPHDKKKKVVSEDELEEAAKPDFLDLDGDGDKEEPMKDAAKSRKMSPDEKKKSDALGENKKFSNLMEWATGNRRKK